MPRTGDPPPPQTGDPLPFEDPPPEAESLEAEPPSPPKEWQPDYAKLQALNSYGMGAEYTMVQKPHESREAFQSAWIQWQNDCVNFINNEQGQLLGGRPAMMGRESTTPVAASPPTSGPEDAPPEHWSMKRWCEEAMGANPDWGAQHFVVNVYEKTYAQGKEPSQAQMGGLQGWRNRQPDPRVASG